MNAVLKSLTYGAGATTGADDIRFDIWNQAVVETTATVPVTVLTGGSMETWTGLANSDWNNPPNWSGGTVPVSGDTVSISGGTPNNPSLSNATLTDETITLSNAATAVFSDVTLNSGHVVLSGGSDLILGGSIIGGDVTFNGAATLSLSQPDAFANGATITGFGQGDQIDLFGAIRSSNLSFSNGVLSVAGSEAIPFAGSYQLGNFPTEIIGGPSNPQIIAYAPNAGASGIVQPDIIAPTAASVTQGAPLSLGQVSINGLATTSDGVSVDAGSGALYMNGASGSGTNHLSLSGLTADQINTDLASLAYVPAAGSSADTVTISAFPPAPVESLRSIAISVTGTGPMLSEPSGEMVPPAALVAIAGSYNDSFAQHNPGMLFLAVSDTSGTLSATDGSGNPVAGSGSNSIALSSDYAGVNAILASLHYTAGPSAGSDTIHFDIWNQAGMETTGSTSVTIAPSVLLSGGGSGSALNSAVEQPIVALPTLGV